MIRTMAFPGLLNINKCNRPAFTRLFSDDKTKNPHPIRRTLELLTNDMRKVKKFFTPSKEKHEEILEESQEQISYGNEFQTHCDVLVIGGEGVGASTAYWLKKKARQGLNVVVVERDLPHFNKACLTLPVGGLHQQFLLPENIEMALYGAEFLRNSKEKLCVDVKFDPHGFLTLASEENAETLRSMSQVQNEFGARTQILTPERLRLKFPWLNTEDVALGCLALEKHGWFDSNNLLSGLRDKAKEFGTHFLKAELIDFEFQSQTDIIVEGGGTTNTYTALDKAIIKMPNGDKRSIKFAICVIAAGTNSERIARLAKIGTGAGILQVPLPIRRRLCHGHIFGTNAINAPGLATPCIIDLNGKYFRRDGLTGNYITGFSSCQDSDSENVPKENHFESTVLPYLTHRMKTFSKPHVTETWESSYEYNVFDENGIIGPHAYYNNLYIATGFSGLGLQLAPAVGRAISELIIDGQFRTIDLTRLGFDRIVVDRPMFEYGLM
ncbi:PREDICTED: FAD-dependent oxidoreductase domain-containing protein 1 [Rhagoletis zephyria]|uniref:FAD-dependent oxidoreductase domain-containing protein 1 n=1 Tax=Rhagoletis zephyria TaxID=28612 RepID=UPI0008114D02|nr:PREDICTED: FAD-dependent oxidoreductase domain-containing protein 1 [Rhagoletis zephyria]